LILGLVPPVLYLLANHSGMLLVQLGDLAFTLFAGSCSILAFLMIRRTGWHSRLGFMYAGMFASMLLIFSGSVVDCYYVFMLQVTVPSPSVADIFNFLGYACAAGAALQFLWYFRTAFTHWRYRLVPLIGLLVAGPNICLSHPNLAMQTPLIADATWLAYPVLDATLLVLAIMLLLLFSGGFVSSPWRWFAIGLIFITVADSAVGVGNIEGWSQFVQPLCLFYFWGYICLGLGFSLMPKPRRLHPLERDYHKAKFMQPVT